MADDKLKRGTDAPGEGGEETFLERWSRLKTGGTPEARDEPAMAESPAPEPPAPDDEPPRVLTDADMPDLDSIDEHSDVSGFLSAGVSEGLRRKALRKLFRGAKFNIRDGLDDYDDDFRTFAPLGGIVTADMRYQMERQIEAAKAAAKRHLASLGEDDSGTSPAVAGSGGEPSSAGDAGSAAAAGDEANTPSKDDSDEDSRHA